MAHQRSRCGKARIIYGSKQPMPRPAGAECATVRDDKGRIVAHVFGSDLDQTKERVRKIASALGLAPGKTSQHFNMLNRLQNRLPGKVTHAKPDEESGGLRFSYDGQRYHVTPSLSVGELHEGVSESVEFSATDRTRLIEELLRGGES